MARANLQQSTIALLGEAQVGKKSFLHRIATGQMGRGLPNVKGIETTSFKMPMYYYGNMDIDIADIGVPRVPRQERLKFYKRTVGALIMADLSRPETVERVPRMIAEYRSVKPDSIILVLLNKADLVDFDGPLIENKNSVITFATSVLTGFNLDLPGLFYRKLALLRQDRNYRFPNLPLANLVNKARYQNENRNDSDEESHDSCSYKHRNSRK